ncbi:hypothetical protein GCM10027160_49820 [Streptomyces calidiresistens]|uniref:Lipoprotein n=1 Tax=Streptomyces calidiresistens TaxID=1485586 RepID=A0A7W3T3V9_9ACTN|nr:hypothetical protein [Streptomyces calidiresistens]MBB0230464.1 hypothetical protein [Streptomyces calidiresistens]
MRDITRTLLGAAASAVVLLLGAASCSSGDGARDAEGNGSAGEAGALGDGGDGDTTVDSPASAPPRLPDGDIEAWAAMMHAIHGIEWKREGEPAESGGHLVWEGAVTVEYDPADHVAEGSAAAGEKPSEAEYRAAAHTDTDGRPLTFRCEARELPAYHIPMPKGFLGDCATAAGLEGVLPEEVGGWLSLDGNRDGPVKRTVIGGAELELRDDGYSVRLTVRPAE